MSFEPFDPKPRPKPRPGRRAPPSVTVTDAKLLLVNRAATEALGLPRRVLLYFDRKGRRAGIRGTEEEGPRLQRDAPLQRQAGVHSGATLRARLASSRIP